MEANVYNLLMSGNETLWDSSPAKFSRDRIFEYTDANLVKMFTKADGNINETLFAVPALFAYEFPNKKDAYFGRIKHVEYFPDEVLIHFEKDEYWNPIPFKVLKELQWSLEFEKFEQYRHHWAIKSVDLGRTLAQSEHWQIKPSDKDIKETESFLTGKTEIEPPSEIDKNLVFVSYAHADRVFMERLQTHLRSLERFSNIEAWDDRRIEAGDDWLGAIQTALDNASAAILLVSADFLASDFISENELPALLQKAHNSGTRIIPVLVKPSAFTSHPVLSVFQAINSPQITLIEANEGEQERVYARVAETVLSTFKTSTPAPDPREGA
jgi:hypothetical protein